MKLRKANFSLLIPSSVISVVALLQSRFFTLNRYYPLGDLGDIYENALDIQSKMAVSWPGGLLWAYSHRTWKGALTPWFLVPSLLWVRDLRIATIAVCALLALLFVGYLYGCFRIFLDRIQSTFAVLVVVTFGPLLTELHLPDSYLIALVSLTAFFYHFTSAMKKSRRMIHLVAAGLFAGIASTCRPVEVMFFLLPMGLFFSYKNVQRRGIWVSGSVALSVLCLWWLPECSAMIRYLFSSVHQQSALFNHKIAVMTAFRENFFEAFGVTLPLLLVSVTCIGLLWRGRILREFFSNSALNIIFCLASLLTAIMVALGSLSTKYFCISDLALLFVLLVFLLRSSFPFKRSLISLVAISSFCQVISAFGNGGRWPGLPHSFFVAYGTAPPKQSLSQLQLRYKLRTAVNSNKSDQLKRINIVFNSETENAGYARAIAMNLSAYSKQDNQPFNFERFELGGEKFSLNGLASGAEQYVLLISEDTLRSPEGVLTSQVEPRDLSLYKFEYLATWFANVEFPDIPFQVILYRVL